MKHDEFMRRRGLRKLDRQPMAEGKHSPTLGASLGSPEGQAKPKKGKGNPAKDLERTTALEENPEPMRRRMWTMPKGFKRRWNKVKKILSRLKEVIDYLWYQRPWRPLTPEEKKIKEDYKHRKEMEALLKDEARIARKRITNRLNGRELCYRKRQYERDFLDAILGDNISSVRFSDIVLQPDALYFKVDTLNLPRGVGILDLVDESILTDLSVACQHTIRAEYTEKKGLWYVLERASGVRGIPKHVRYQDALDSYPATAGKFVFPAGVTENSKYIYRDLVTMPHLLIAGSTDSGKSNMMHIVITALIQRTTPRDMRLLLVDLKGGIECAAYEGIPHLLEILEPRTIPKNQKPADDNEDDAKPITETGIIYDRAAVPDALDFLIKEGEIRMRELKKAGHQNIDQYNRQRRNHRMPRIVLVIDEWADIRLVPGLGNKAEDKLSNIASRMRAVGIHVILATQSPKSQVISTLIKTNLPGKMAFSCPTNTASILIIDSGAARGLQPRGRYIFQKGTEQIEIQAPYISPTHLKKIVASVTKGSGKKVLLRGHDVTAEEVIITALDQYDGRMKLGDLYLLFKGRLTQRALRDLLAGMDRQIYDVRGESYQVEPPAGKLPRILKLVK